MKHSRRRTKIVATAGPSADTKAVIARLINEGVNVVRLNFAHGDHAEHARRIRLIREAAAEAGLQVGILQDLPGPKIRVGRLPASGLDVKLDEMVVLVAKADDSPGKRIPVSYPRLVKDLKIGDTVFIADGMIRLVVQSVTARDVRCRVTNGGTIRSGNGVNMPHSSLHLKAFTREDRRHLAFGLRLGVDFIGISFVGDAQDLRDVKAFCRRRRPGQPAPFVIAKIERQAALRNLDDIIAETDGLMVARGDLGVEAPFYEIPGLQKKIVSAARHAGKPVIVATQVLETMIQNPRPTRAEATDISNAILEGADAIMLSGETAAGKYPVESVRALAQVIEATEKTEFLAHLYSGDLALGIPDLISKAACKVANRLGARFVMVPTRTGKAAMRVSRFRPEMPIIALARTEALQRRLVLSWGVQSLPAPRAVHHDLASAVRALLLRRKLARRGDRIILVGDDPDSRLGQTSMLKVVEI